jgi:Protein of unknown function (DUF1353)
LRRRIEEVVMPFRTFTWQNGSLVLGDRTPDPELRQVDEDAFVILRSFAYRAAHGDPDEGVVYLVPGEDFESPPGELAEGVVVPPDTGGRTDLASVPSLFWWLIASYGNHTRASLLHDALYVENGEPPVPRRTADRLFLGALREPGPQKGGAFRHWLMWAAVSAFGTMRFKLGLVFGLHLVSVWALTIGATVWAWHDGIAGIEWSFWPLAVLALGGLVYLVGLGSSWRAGVDVRAGWLVPTAMASLLVVIPLASEWPSPFELGWSAFTLLAAALVLTLVGPLWGLWVDPTLRGWLWPTALIALPIAVVPVVLILVAIVLVWLVDLGASLAASLRKTPAGKDRPFELPSLKTTGSRV